MLVSLVALLPTSDYFYNAAFALRPCYVARDLGWCEHVYLRWGGHSLTVISAWFFPMVLVTPASLIGSELLHCSHCGAPAFICVSLPLWGKALVLPLRVFAFFLHYLQAFKLLEGEAHYAAVLALVLKVDCLVVVVDHDLRGHPAGVVEPLCPLGDVFVHYLLCLLAHRCMLLPSLVFLYPEEAPYIPQKGACQSSIQARVRGR